jgi:hypothetical protein
MVALGTGIYFATMRPYHFLYVLIGVVSACSSLGPRKAPRHPPLAVLQASGAYDPATAEIRLACTVRNEGTTPLALLYASDMESTQPGWGWQVNVINDRGVQMLDCSARLPKLRIPQASDYTVLPTGQQLALTFRVKARALVLPQDEGRCRQEQGPVPVGKYTLQVKYFDGLLHHRQAVNRLQIPAPLLLTVE